VEIKYYVINITLFYILVLFYLLLHLNIHFQSHSQDSENAVATTCVGSLPSSPIPIQYTLFSHAVTHLGLLYPKDKATVILWNVRNCSPSDIASLSGRL